MYTVFEPASPPSDRNLEPDSVTTAWSIDWMIFGFGAKRVYASTSFNACETDSWPNGHLIFFNAKSSAVDLS